MRIKKDKIDLYNYHLGNLLYILKNLHPAYKSKAFNQAMKFYNEENPHIKIFGEEGFETFLINIHPGFGTRRQQILQHLKTIKSMEKNYEN